MVELAVATSTTVQSWLDLLDSDPRLVATAVTVLQEQAEQSKRGGKRP